MSWFGKLLGRKEEREVRFRYFQEPHRYSTYSEEAQACDLCGKERPGYEGPFYGYGDEVEFVCELCLVQGKLVKAELSTNDGDMKALLEQLNKLYPMRWQEGNEVEAETRRLELEHRTPAILTFQDMLWPAHCGDFVRYVKEVGQQDLQELAGDGDGKQLFRELLKQSLAGNLSSGDEGQFEEMVDGVWSDMPTGSPTKPADAHVGVYLFQCLHCGEYLVRFDTD
ncbi:MAG TPA: CbrC family protein [Bacilli bacterium]|nr:CbrC family protein [Bacilli bacterium]